MTPGARRSFGLGIEVGAPQEGRGPWLGLSFRLPGPYEHLYGGRVAGALSIVAIDTATGRVRHRSGEPGHPVALPPRGDPEDAPRRGRSIGGAFRRDLARHLGLGPGAYLVFAWLDDLASESVVVEIGAAPSVGAVAEGSVELRRSDERLEGMVRARGPLATTAPGALTVLLLDHESRELSWLAERAPRDILAGAEWRFSIALAGLARGPAAGKRTAIAVFEALRSVPVTF